MTSGRGRSAVRRVALIGMTTTQHRIVAVGGGQGLRDVYYLDRYGLPFMDWNLRVRGLA